MALFEVLIGPLEEAVGPIDIGSKLLITSFASAGGNLPFSNARIKLYQSRLQALGEAERRHEMITSAAYAMDRSVPNDVLAMADRIWFGADRPFQAAREAFPHIEDDLERWEQELEAERSHICNVSHRAASILICWR
ncbi:hypothetical protein ACVIRO_007640 [Rhizobium ruizarguesonis]